MKFKLTGLWKHTEFRKLWAGQSISLTGTQLMMFALSVTAVVFLDATPIQMGIVISMQGVPAIFGLFMGSWTDRRRKLPIIIGVDVGRFILLLVIPWAYLLDVLTIELLYVVVFGIGTMGMLFQIAYRSLLPAVVNRDELLEANSKLEIATAGSVAVGPALGGALIQIITAPLVLIFSSASFAISAVFFSRMRVAEVAVNRGDSQEPGGEIREGLSYFRKNRTLIGMAISGTSLGIFSGVLAAVFLIFYVKHLEIEPGLLGVILGIGSVGLFAGSIVSSKYSTRIGVGRLMALGLVLSGIAWLIVPIVDGPLWFVFVALVAAAIAQEAGIVITSVQQVSLRQSITPAQLHGRINSIFLVLTRFAIPVGALVGGLLGETIGVRNTMFVGALGIGSSAIWVVLFGVWRVRELPTAQFKSEILREPQVGEVVRSSDPSTSLGKSDSQDDGGGTIS